MNIWIDTLVLHIYHTKSRKLIISTSKKDQGAETKKLEKLSQDFDMIFIHLHFSVVHYAGNLLTVVFIVYTNLSDSKVSVSDVLFIPWFLFCFFIYFIFILALKLPSMWNVFMCVSTYKAFYWICVLVWIIYKIYECLLSISLKTF